MARVPYIDPEDLPEEHRKLIHSRLGKPVNNRRALVNNPAMLKVVSGIGKWFREEAPLDPRLRELAVLQVGYSTANAYEFSHHVVISAEYGVTDADIKALIAETLGEDSGLPALDRAVLRTARDLTVDVELADETWEAIEAGLGRERAMELVGVIAYYNYQIRMLRGLAIDLEPEFEEPLSRYEPLPGSGGWH